MDARVHAPPVAAPGPSAWPKVTAERDAYRHVRAAGVLANDRETRVQALTDLGAGYWVVTPLRTDEGFTVLVNRGFVPQDRADPATRKAGQVAGPATVTGLLRVTEPGGSPFQRNDPAHGLWYSRDVAAMAAARGVGGAAPYFIDADATPNPGGLPVGGLTVVAFRNSHLVYAATWCALALMVLAAAAFVARQELWARRAARSG